MDISVNIQANAGNLSIKNASDASDTKATAVWTKYYEPLFPIPSFDPSRVNLALNVFSNSGSLTFVDPRKQYAGAWTEGNSVNIHDNTGTISHFRNSNQVYNVFANSGTVKLDGPLGAPPPRTNIGRAGSLASVRGVIDYSGDKVDVTGVSTPHTIVIDDRNNPAPGKEWVLGAKDIQVGDLALKFTNYTLSTVFNELWAYPNAGSTVRFEAEPPFFRANIFGAGAGNTLVGPPRAEGITWRIEGPDQGAMALRPNAKHEKQPNEVHWAGFQNLVGGSTDDDFQFLGGSVSGSIDGGGGTNTLRYDPAPTPFIVDLARGIAPLVGGTVKNIQVVVPGIAIGPIETQRFRAGESVSLTVHASTASGQPVEFRAEGLPNGLSIDPKTGVISGILADDTDIGTGTAWYYSMVFAAQGKDEQSVWITWEISAGEGGNEGDAETATTVEASLDSATYGDALTFTATVAFAAAGAAAPSGSVQFLIDGVEFGPAVILINGVATSQMTRALAAGGHTIAARYSGDVGALFSLGESALVVSRARLTATADDQHRANGQDGPALTYTITGFVNGETATVVSGTPTLETNASTNSAAGRYAIAIGAGSLGAANYEIANLVSGTLVVHPRIVDVVVRWGSQSMSLIGLDRNLPFANIQAIDVIFSDDMAIGSAPISLNSRLDGSSKGSLSYNAASKTARFGFTSPILIDRLLLDIDQMAGALVDPSVTLLEGLKLNVNVLAGDYNNDGMVTAADAVQIRNRIGAAYDPFADINGIGVVDLDSMTTARRFLGSKLAPSPQGANHN